jgi:hypothetical protein
VRFVEPRRRLLFVVSFQFCSHLVLLVFVLSNISVRQPCRHRFERVRPRRRRVLIRTIVHGKSLQSSSQVAGTTEAGRAAAALTGGAGLDAIGVKEYTAYTSTCYDARSVDPINTDAATRTEQLDRARAA